MDRKRIYIAGPVGKGDLAHNVNQATEAFVKLAKLGFAPFCPHWGVYAKPCVPILGCIECTGTITGNDDMSHEDWMGIDLAWVKVSDGVLRLPGESIGADMETKCALENEISVFHSVEDLVEWLKNA